MRIVSGKSSVWVTAHWNTGRRGALH